MIINEHIPKSNRAVTLLASGWSSSVPYTQTLTVQGVNAGDEPIIAAGKPLTLDSASYKALNKAFGMIDRITTGDGTITAYCYTNKPTVNVPIVIKF